MGHPGLRRAGRTEKAQGLFALVNPINHALTAAAVERYKVEPYVVAADVYSVAPHVGRGGWTWYTGSAGWMQRAGIEGILGIRREGDVLTIAPCIPRDWPGFEARIKVGGADYDIRVEVTATGRRARPKATLDGRPLPLDRGQIRVGLDGLSHVLKIELRTGTSGV